MTSHHPDPLTPEERELAERLARIGPHGAPSPALDARILGAAHAAAARKPIASPRRNWPAWAGIAATLALALGAVWQLRPVQEVPVVLDEAPSAAIAREQSGQSSVAASEQTAVAMDMISGNGRAEPPPPPPPARSIAPLPPPPAEVHQAKVAPVPAAEIAPPKPRAQPSAPAPAPAPVIFDEPSPVDVPAPPPAPPAPSPVKPAAPMAARSRAPKAWSTEPASMQAESTVADAPSLDAATGASLTVTDLAVESDRALPPVDWIERIRQRREAGDLASARASLELLQRDHPQLVLPDDLRALATSSSPDQ